ncbi:MAG TPA: UDP-N-acetylglucosamine 2-epimerase (non-hydrolyzing) [Bacteroidia bacterium]|jgi:UDP-GlcNAc3NAcA epimerase|nr:UDP-N-acetylglucosamine 2-epimerase (non-hydrolyzing) [Bacteroidia bacterium]
MLKILTIIGARPQIIKAAALSRAIRTHFSSQIKEIIVHTGQHYDENMSEVFFSELNIPRADYNLGVGSGSHGTQTAAMITGIEKILLEEKPGAIVLFGDTNSTLAGAVAASKLNIPVVHIEAGLRSFNRTMPEEINRILCDHVSTLLFSPTKAGVDNLAKEGIVDGGNKKASAVSPAVYHCGDVMYDNSIYFSELAESKSDILKKHGLEKGKYFLATIHRDSNTDVQERLKNIFVALVNEAQKHSKKVILPLHPRTKKQIALDASLQKLLDGNEWIVIIPPASFFEMIVLEKNAALVFTDSGGVQKEAFYFQRPCVILRAETEWVELVECGAAKLADAFPGKIESSTDELLNAQLHFPALFGDGHAAEFICKEMLRHLSNG